MEILKNDKKMLKISNYDIPKNVYKVDGIPNEIVNEIITGTINNDTEIVRAGIDFLLIEGFLYPDDREQITAIATLCAYTELDIKK
jgi:hypothetical protein